MSITSQFEQRRHDRAVYYRQTEPKVSLPKKYNKSPKSIANRLKEAKNKGLEAETFGQTLIISNKRDEFCDCGNYKAEHSDVCEECL